MPDRRTVAIVGPSLGGKTSLLESIAFVSKAIQRKGSVREGTSIGDFSPEARARQGSIEVSAAHVAANGVDYTLLDCPGSIDFASETYHALMGVDAALVVVEPVAERAMTLAPLFHVLNQFQVPHLIFINKMDRASALLRDVIPAMQAVSGRPLVMHQVPIRSGESVTGYVDLVSEQAYAYRPGAPSDQIALPEEVKERETTARTEMLERLADFDDAIMEKLLEDQAPSPEEIEASMCKDVADNQLVPVFVGSAERDHGVRRLLAHMAQLVPTAAATAARRKLGGNGAGIAQALKTYMTGQGGKLTLVRVWRGAIGDGDMVNGQRVGGVYRLMGAQQQKIDRAEAGDVVALGRLDSTRTGETLAVGDKAPDAPLPRPEPMAPTFAMAIHAQKRDDDVKLSGALAKLLDEDPSLAVDHDHQTNQLILRGQGDIHLHIAFERLKNRYKLPVVAERPKVPYKEAIRKPVIQHGRFKRQTGGHGMFGDVHLEIKPLPRGAGFEYGDRVVGGSVPRQFIPAVENGVREYLVKGPLGFPVVDLSVTLFDGSYHNVDSNEMSFKLAAKMAMTEGMPKCGPVLLEPIWHVDVSAPNAATAKINALVSGRRGHILGLEAKDGWEGWDVVSAQLPQTELHDLILELRSLSQGVGTYTSRFDHLAELTGRLADQIVQAHAETDAKAS
ncbi:MAG: elongation factor G [Alphaproteobacteria bacterium]|nr:elongation factor G [Alphaproteobacteria bacterium]